MLDKIDRVSHSLSLSSSQSPPDQPPTNNTDTNNNNHTTTTIISHSNNYRMTPSVHTNTQVTQLPRLIDGGALVLKDMLGVGAYGSVYRAVDTRTSEIYAVKSLNNTGLNSRQRAFQSHEANLHAMVSDHRNIATLHRVVEEDDCLHMVLDCGLEGDLFYKITERGGFVGNDQAIKSIFGQITSAVLHCHSRGVYHRDLKVNKNSFILPLHYHVQSSLLFHLPPFVLPIVLEGL